MMSVCEVQLLYSKLVSCLHLEQLPVMFIRRLHASNVSLEWNESSFCMKLANSVSENKIIKQEGVVRCPQV